MPRCKIRVMFNYLKVTKHLKESYSEKNNK